MVRLHVQLQVLLKHVNGARAVQQAVRPTYVSVQCNARVGVQGHVQFRVLLKHVNVILRYTYVYIPTYIHNYKCMHTPMHTQWYLCGIIGTSRGTFGACQLYHPMHHKLYKDVFHARSSRVHCRNATVRRWYPEKFSCTKYIAGCTSDASCKGCTILVVRVPHVVHEVYK